MTVDTERPAAEPRPREQRRSAPLFAGWGLIGWSVILAATLFLAWSAWALLSATQSGERDTARDRDVVLRSGRAHLTALNSMDVRDVPAGLKAWEDAATGDLAEQLRRDAPQNRQKIAQAGTSAKGTVTDAAVTKLDAETGDATMIASVRILLTTSGGDATEQRQRFEAGLTRTPAGWRLKSLTAIPAGQR
ncbi:hypothetical protein [Actinomadura flavalba]|uniref:hypothetical protein n=1 Tax=Actinomadura flavalba TaxID=1120938 RepID=UPI00037E2508|nr:hypothetical protein [Actinomadura flavalba]